MTWTRWYLKCAYLLDQATVDKQIVVVLNICVLVFEKKDIKTGILNAWISYGAVSMKLFIQNGSYEEFHSKSSWEHGSELMDINMY